MVERIWRLLFSRDHIVNRLEKIQDFIVVSLCVGLFSIMLIRLGMMFAALLEPRNFKEVTSDILFVLILVEVFRLLIIYLKEQRISVGAALEVSVVSVLREVILEGALEIPLKQLLGVCAFLGVLGGLLFLRVWMYQKFNEVEIDNINRKAADTNPHLLTNREYKQYPF